MCLKCGAHHIARAARQFPDKQQELPRRRRGAAPFLSPLRSENSQLASLGRRSRLVIALLLLWEAAPRLGLRSVAADRHGRRLGCRSGCPNWHGMGDTSDANPSNPAPGTAGEQALVERQRGSMVALSALMSMSIGPVGMVPLGGVRIEASVRSSRSMLPALCNVAQCEFILFCLNAGRHDVMRLVRSAINRSSRPAIGARIEPDAANVPVPLSSQSANRWRSRPARTSARRQLKSVARKLPK